MSDIHNHLGDTGPDMDVDAPFIRQQFSGAVETLTPDIAALVAGGAAAGRRLRRTRRTQLAGGLAAVAVVASLAAGGVATFVNDGKAPPADSELQQLVPATPQGLAAAVMKHTDSLGSLTAVGEYPDDSATLSEQLAIGIGYQTSDGTKVEIDAFATENASIPGPGETLCDLKLLKHATCTPSVGHDGQLFAVLSQPNMISAVRVADGLEVIVNEVVPGKHPSYPLSGDDLLEIVNDQTVGLRTTEAINDLGAKITDFAPNLLRSSGSSGSSSGPVVESAHAPTKGDR